MRLIYSLFLSLVPWSGSAPATFFKPLFRAGKNGDSLNQCPESRRRRRDFCSRTPYPTPKPRANTIKNGISKSILDSSEQYYRSAYHGSSLMRREFSHYSADLPMFSRTVVVLLSASTGQSRSLRQFSNFHRDPPRLVFGEQLGRRTGRGECDNARNEHRR